MTMPRRRWFSFSLRMMLVLVALFGLWLRQNMHWIEQRHEMLKILPEFAEIVRDGKNNAPPPAPWSIRLLGESGIAEIWIHEMSTGNADGAVKMSKRLFPEAKVVVGYPPGSGGGFF